jgi:di/tricarboxylate transporter
MSILLLLYALLLLRLLRPLKPKEGQNELTEREKSHERLKPVSILGVSAVMIFLLGWIFYKNRVVWLVPGSVGLTLISGACLLLVVADYIQYKLTGKKASLVPIPIWVVLFFMLINRALSESGG